MRIVNSSSRHAWFEIWIWFPPMKWKWIMVYWNFAELVNFKIGISWTISTNIELWLPFGKLIFGWSTGNYTRDVPWFGFQLFRQRKSTSEILTEDGWETIDKALKYDICPTRCEGCPGAERKCTEEDAMNFISILNQDFDECSMDVYDEWDGECQEMDCNKCPFFDQCSKHYEEENNERSTGLDE